MRSQIAAVIALGVLLSNAIAQDDSRVQDESIVPAQTKAGGGAVPKALFEAIGLGGIVVVDSPQDPSDDPVANAPPTPSDAVMQDKVVAQDKVVTKDTAATQNTAAAARKAAEARRRRIIEALAIGADLADRNIESASRKTDAAFRRLDFAKVEQKRGTLDLAKSELARINKQLKSARLDAQQKQMVLDKAQSIVDEMTASHKVADDHRRRAQLNAKRASDKLRRIQSQAPLTSSSQPAENSG